MRQQESKGDDLNYLDVTDMKTYCKVQQDLIGRRLLFVSTLVPGIINTLS